MTLTIVDHVVHTAYQRPSLPTWLRPLGDPAAPTHLEAPESRARLDSGVTGKLEGVHRVKGSWVLLRHA